MWQIAKAARVLRGEIPVNEPTPDALSRWLAARLLPPEQLAAFEHEVMRTPRDA